MRPPKTPRLTLPAWFDRFRPADPESDTHAQDEHERNRLVLVVSIVGFVVAVGLIAGFVLMVAQGGGTASANPPVPSITDAGNAESQGNPPIETTTPPPTTTTTKAKQPVERPAEVVTPKPKPKPSPTTSSSTSEPDVRFAEPYDRCAPEGAQALTPRYHYLLECRFGQWRFVGGDDDDDDDDGPGHGHGHGHGH